MKSTSHIAGGLDVHKTSLAVAGTCAGRGTPECYGEISNDVVLMRKRINPDGEVRSIFTRVGPCSDELCTAS